ncbi:unnamed protein product [Rotaria socialis]|uniref:Uncharacterized protein n=1 Tax=Rotaria socialis TaxID=392032 RepID=A0A818RIT5_9BILA|nr:unnamed protein product [Rotaria socialis]CAF4408987.1 unnamed protein product [Rotaria socialis]
MADLNKQYQCSSKAIIYNATIFSKRRQTYLIVDIEPVIDNSQPLDDRSISSLFKDYYTYARPSNDSSINNIIFGIGLVVVILLLLVIVIKLIYKCYKMYHDDNGNENDDDDKEEVNKSPLLTSTAVRRDSSLRNPTAPAIRSSLNLETQMELRQKHLSKTFSDTPPTQKKL